MATGAPADTVSVQVSDPISSFAGLSFQRLNAFSLNRRVPSQRRLFRPCTAGPDVCANVDIILTEYRPLKWSEYGGATGDTVVLAIHKAVVVGRANDPSSGDHWSVWPNGGKSRDLPPLTSHFVSDLFDVAQAKTQIILRAQEGFREPRGKVVDVARLFRHAVKSLTAT